MSQATARYSTALVPHDPDAVTYNAADNGSNVGIQAGSVTGSTVHLTTNVFPPPPGASAEEKYRGGVRLLDDGVPFRARELITEALAEGYDNAEVRFHWALAMLSKRAYRDLESDEREQVACLSGFLPRYPDDEWKRALEAVCELLAYLRSRSRPDLVQERLASLKTHQREKIDRHLSLALEGVVNDGIWDETLRRAKADQYSARRDKRVWAYFQPLPVEARARHPAEVSIPVGHWARTVGWSGLFTIAVGYLAWTNLTLGRFWPILATSIALGAGYVAASTAFNWRYRVGRLRTKEVTYFGELQESTAPEGGFARKIDNSFAYYFALYVPDNYEREEWLAATARTRRTLRDEVVEIYRESRISAERVNWLIRYLVGEVGKLWEAEREHEYRERYRTAWSTKAWCIISLLTLVLTTLAVVSAAVPHHPFTALIAAFASLKGAWSAAPRWMHIIGEHRRYNEEDEDYWQTLVDRQAAFDRWKTKLDETRPREGEMEYWLYCDTTALLGEALRHYKLAWRDVLTHAFLQVPAKHYKRARVTGGPWRFSKYDISLFLITKDGVREYSGELDFEHTLFSKQHRTNYRFEAVSSVRIAKERELGYTMQLTLSNGPSRDIRITESAVYQLDPGEDPEEASRINIDAAGFAHTLHILEGIAAEGKKWIERDQHTNPGPEDSR
jgi:hypothetical protein